MNIVAHWSESEILRRWKWRRLIRDDVTALEWKRTRKKNSEKFQGESVHYAYIWQKIYIVTKYQDVNACSRLTFCIMTHRIKVLIIRLCRLIFFLLFLFFLSKLLFDYSFIFILSPILSHSFPSYYIF